MRHILFACGFLLSSVAVARAAVVDGTWKISGSVADNPVVGTCTLSESSGKLTGTCTGTDGKMVPATGTLTDKTVVWSYVTTYNGGDITLTYTGKLDSADHITGTLLVDPYAASGDFTATRDVPAPEKKP